ncbi:MAG: hypothetical protein HY812_19310 [Planctomycetes bacterium]|nr:hypothetical protein [Planctomycetota bacterium]
MTSAEGNGACRVWPRDRFFFAVLDATPLPRSLRRARKALGYLFEDALPLPIEAVQPAYLRLDERQVLACGVEKERLAREVEPHVLSLTPDSLPDFCPPGASPEGLNVLTGEFEPVLLARRRGQRKRRMLLAALAVACLALTGLERRIADCKENGAALNVRQAEILDDVLGPGREGVPEAQRRAALTAELRRLERTRASSPKVALEDASVLLARLLAAWPEDLPARIEAATLSRASITLRGLSPTPGEAQALASRLAGLAGWSVEPPQFSTARETTHFTLRLGPNAGGRP